MRKRARQRYHGDELDNPRGEETETENKSKTSNQEIHYEVVMKNGICVSVPVVEEKNVVQFSSSGHVNFFTSLEEGQQVEGTTNKEHDLEKKNEQEEYEKQIGLLTYLGQGSREITGEVPWYEKPSLIKSLQMQEKTDEKIEKSKSFYDPLRVVQHYMGHKETPKAVKKLQPASSSVTLNEDYSVKTEKQKSLKRKHKEKKAKKRKKTDKDAKRSRTSRKHARRSRSPDSTSSESSESDSEKKEKLQILRTKRLEREKKERAKTRNLLNSVNGISDDKIPEKKTLDETKPIIQQKYYSQYNPETAKQNKPLDSNTKYWLQ